MKPGRLKSIAFCLFTAGAVLRLVLCWSNPPSNAFDQHYEPIRLIMTTGAVPGKYACWQCYHPPVFYWISAKIGSAALACGVDRGALPKLLQYVSCSYGILTLAIIHLILQRLPLSNFARLLAFGTVCFLPRHIYMSAMHSNDTASYLFVALSVYLLLVAFERRLQPAILLLLSLAVSLAIFTKYTAFVVLPALAVALGTLLRKQLITSRSRVTLLFVMVMALPLMLLGAYFFSNAQRYGTLLPSNFENTDPNIRQPKEDRPVEFFTFKPWESVSMPILTPGRMHSFWTLVYTSMWFDSEPKFINHADSNLAWWWRYYGFLRGEERFPGISTSLPAATMLAGSGLIALGLVPLVLAIRGSWRALSGGWKEDASAGEAAGGVIAALAVLFLFNAVGIIALTMRLPEFTSMKGSYFLVSLPAFVTFLGFGLEGLEKRRALKWSSIVLFGLLFSLVTFHIFYLSLSMADPLAYTPSL